jgi:hypothetical protein
VFRFTNGYQDVGASARWSLADGFTFGYNDYTTGTALCESTGPSNGDKCILYPGDQPIQGDVNQATGTIRISIPRYLLRALSGSTAAGQRPVEVGATVGSRFYDATAFSLGNTVSPTQRVQSFLYPFDNTPSMDFLLPAAPTPPPPTVPCKITGSGTIPGSGGSTGRFSLNVHVGTPPTGSIAYRDSNTDFRATSITSAACSDASHGHVTGAGKNNGDDVTYTVDVVDGGESSSNDVFTLTMSPGGTRSGTLQKGNVQVHKN